MKEGGPTALDGRVQPGMKVTAVDSNCCSGKSLSVSATLRPAAGGNVLRNLVVMVSILFSAHSCRGQEMIRWLTGDAGTVCVLDVFDPNAMKSERVYITRGLVPSRDSIIKLETVDSPFSCKNGVTPSL